jgi:hypothetical protein
MEEREIWWTPSVTVRTPPFTETKWRFWFPSEGAVK